MTFFSFNFELTKHGDFFEAITIRSIVRNHFTTLSGLFHFFFFLFPYTNLDIDKAQMQLNCFHYFYAKFVDKNNLMTPKRGVTIKPTQRYFFKVHVIYAKEEEQRDVERILLDAFLASLLLTTPIMFPRKQTVFKENCCIYV